MKVRIGLALGGVLLILLLVRPQEVLKPHLERRIVLGTLVEIKLYVEPEQADSLMDLAYAEIARIDSLMSHFSTASELHRINQGAADTAVSCSAEMAQVLGRSMHLGQLAGGAFDITMGTLTRLWNFPEAKGLPVAAQITAALGDHRYLSLEWRAGQSYVRLSPDARLDLGGVAKGFAVDQAAARLQQVGVACGLIEAGGDIYFWGTKPGGQGWRFGVQHPRQPQQIIQVDDLGLPALATSGDYEQFFIHEGQRFHHLLDPATGYPGRKAVSATVWATAAMDADILATTVFVLGPEAGLKLVESLPQTEALVFFERNGRLQHRVSSGAVEYVRFNAAE
jgi:thiamine biosynthesis lipoprotein